MQSRTAISARHFKRRAHEQEWRGSRQAGCKSRYLRLFASSWMMVVPACRDELAKATADYHAAKDSVATYARQFERRAALEHQVGKPHSIVLACWHLCLPLLASGGVKATADDHAAKDSVVTYARQLERRAALEHQDSSSECRVLDSSWVLCLTLYKRVNPSCLTELEPLAGTDTGLYLLCPMRLMCELCCTIACPWPLPRWTLGRAANHADCPAQSSMWARLGACR